MKRSILIKISLIGFFLSFTLITYLDSYNSLETIPIENISLKNLNENVAIKAIITDQSLYKETHFMKIKDETGEMKAIAFKAEEKIEPGEYILIGKIIYYKGELELIVNKIITL